MSTTEIVNSTGKPEAILSMPPITPKASELIHETAVALSDAHTVASALVKTSFVPKHFADKPEEAAAAILYGATIDMDPVTALQQVYVIGGRPALYARAMVAIVISKGHRIWTEEASDAAVTVAGQRKGSNHIERVTWTMERAEKAGYTSNANYKKSGEAMLYARASGDVARRIAPDALLGMSYSVEELQLGAEPTSTKTGPSSFQPPQIGEQPSQGQGEIFDLIASATTKDELTEIWRGLTEEQRAESQAFFSARGQEIDQEAQNA